jgi:hypothetical protein
LTSRRRFGRKRDIESIARYRFSDFDNPRYYNIAWMKLLEEADRT